MSTHDEAFSTSLVAAARAIALQGELSELVSQLEQIVDQRGSLELNSPQVADVVKIARTGVRAAQQIAGILSLLTPRDAKLDAECRAWMEALAKQQDPVGMNVLGIMLNLGLGGRSDAHDARTWLIRAALAGERFARNYVLLQMTTPRWRVLEPLPESMWTDIVDQHTTPVALFSLANAFEEGLSVSRSPERALRLYFEASAHGSYYASMRLSSVFIGGQLGQAADSGRATEFISLAQAQLNGLQK
jgi:TPR repeat protein